MKQNLLDLYRILDAGTRRRLKTAIVGLLAISVFEMIGLVLLLPLMQMFAGATTDSGALGRVSDFFGNPSDSTLAVILAGIVFGAFLTKGLFTLFFRWWMIGFLNVQSARTAGLLFRRFLGAPYALHLRRNSADLVRTVQEGVNQTFMSTVIGMLTIVSEGTTILAVAAVLGVLRPVPTLGMVAYFVIVGFAFLRIVRSRAQRASRDLMGSARDVYQAAFQGLGAIKEVQVRRKEAYFLRRYEDARMVYAKATQMSLFLGEAPRYVMEMLFIVGIALMSIIIFVGNDAQQGAATLGLFVAAGFRMLPSMVRLFASVNAMRIGSEGMKIVVRDLNELAPATDIDEVAQPLELSDGITIEGLGFTYEGTDRAVLEEIDLTIPAGRSLAVVGSSGAGKTTLVDLILGLHLPTEGRILIDGVDLVDVIPHWQRAIGLVPQDVFLLDDSLRANIAFGEADDDIDQERLDEALDRAQLAGLVESLPEGLATEVGERGVRLSGGQRQRIGIARALYLRPKLLVLDEATSSLDSQTERYITDTIDSLHGHQTMLIVAHRLSTVRRCDQLIFMRQGRIETVGTFAEVKRDNAEFAHLVELGSLDAIDDRAAS
ncbi:MAG TPA: ABC transporter ATP-binding protein [Acidimicrobiales bacterium]|nr:ABC transporter ATP-binding protein [Acidimicrobiales bacterium]